MVAELRVGPSGQALLGGRRGSYIGCDRDGTLVPLRPKGRARIEHDGDFSFGGRSRGLKFRVRGRFRSPDLARVTYSVRPRRAFACPPGPRSLRLHRRAGEPPFSSCASQPAQTVTSSPLARVFAQRMVFRWAFLPFAYGCLYSVDRRVVFGLDGFDEAGLGQALDHFRLAGPYAAYGCGGNLRHGCWASVSVVDLRDGTVLHRASISLSLAGLYGSGRGPTDVELKDNGSVAWIGGSEGLREVGAVDAAGERVLDRGALIQADSLTLTGSTLTWRNGDRTHSTILD